MDADAKQRMMESREDGIELHARVVARALQNLASRFETAADGFGGSQDKIAPATDFVQKLQNDLNWTIANLNMATMIRNAGEADALRGVE